MKQALLLVVPLGTSLGERDELAHLFELEDRLLEAVERSGAGEYDGNDTGEGFFTFYMYGSSADRLFDVVAPLLAGFPLPHGSYALKRYGDHGAPEQLIALSQ